MGIIWPFGLSTRDKLCLGRVLVVDDEAPVRGLLRNMLHQAGYDVEEAEDGGKAVDILNSGDNPLMTGAIICDVRILRINGLEASTLPSLMRSCESFVIGGYTAMPGRDCDLSSAFMPQGVVHRKLRFDFPSADS